MLDRIVLHIGMNKTGSTSIQKVLSTLDMPDHHYAQMGPPNHSIRLYTVFGGPAQYEKLLERGFTQAQINRRKRKWRADLEREIAQCSKPCLILSGEGLSSAFCDFEMVRDLGAYLKSKSRTQQVIGYVRKPYSLMNSVFQQRIKNGRLFDNAFEKCEYRDRLEPFDQVFGRDAVTLVPFESDNLKDGDAVSDFAERIGVSLPEDIIAHENESLSTELVAALTVLNSQGIDFGVYPQERVEHTKLVRSLTGLGGGKLTLSESLVTPFIEEASPQIDWLEERMGQPMRDSVRKVPDAVASKADLWELAAAQADALEKRMLDALRDQKDPARRVAEMLDMMRVMQMGRSKPAVDPKDEG